MDIGLIGAGAIGKTLSDSITKGIITKGKLKIIADKSISRAKTLAAEHNCHATSDINELIDFPIDLVIEAASQAVVTEYSHKILEKKRDILIMSVGALLDEKLNQDIKELAEKNNCKIYVPSGAIGGIDILKATKNMGLESVTLTTRKPPKSLGLKNKSLQDKQQEKLIFQGTAREAVKNYPANINVAAILSLAGLGPDKTKVNIICDPNIEYNIHEVEIKGSFGISSFKISNIPNPQNNKTSQLACLSVISTINEISNNIVIGN